ncbi:MAG: UDP-N-acetylmuramoyl-L-alanine--D-glutamate ligase [Clostridia bacterium]|nr:UDP-N-acetylmuramoyl-L-alanine--D-glutamate ligase [Clostridia bacterium]
MNNIQNIEDKKVLVVGLGRSGVAAIEVLNKLGARVYAQDSKERELHEEQLVLWLEGLGIPCYFDCIPDDMNEFDMLVLSPGVNPELDFIQDAKAKGAEIVGELEIAYRISRGTFIGITGTNGKTTTTTLVGEIFKEAKKKTEVVGNIGVAVISSSVESDVDTYMVTECSSFQLETTKYFKPHVSAILNLTPDHLNRHHSFENYGLAKAKIFANENENDYLILNYDDKNCFALGENAKAKIVPFSRKEKLEYGAFLEGDDLVLINDQGEKLQICHREDIKIIGNHNLENVLAAAAISYFAGIDMDSIRRAISKFKGVEHRIEYSGEVEGVQYYNDSKGTNVDAAVTAINAMEKPIILLAGGDGKSQDFKPFVEAFGDKVKALVTLGRDGHFIAEEAMKNGYTNIHQCKDLVEAVKCAHQLASAGDVVLFSPACASWDMYDNFEQRGRHFKDLVSHL